MQRKERLTEIECAFKVALELEKKMFENQSPSLLLPGGHSASRRPLAYPFVKCRSVGSFCTINTLTRNTVNLHMYAYVYAC